MHFKRGKNKKPQPNDTYSLTCTETLNDYVDKNARTYEMSKLTEERLKR